MTEAFSLKMLRSIFFFLALVAAIVSLVMLKESKFDIQHSKEFYDYSIYLGSTCLGLVALSFLLLVFKDNINFSIKLNYIKSLGSKSSLQTLPGTENPDLML